jgi:hypothetical protein
VTLLHFENLGKRLRSELQAKAGATTRLPWIRAVADLGVNLASDSWPIEVANR